MFSATLSKREVKGVHGMFQVSLKVRKKPNITVLLITHHTLSPHKILMYIASYINKKCTLHKKENLLKKMLAKLTKHSNNYHKNARKENTDMLSNPKIFLNHTLCFPTENFKMKNRP